MYLLWFYLVTENFNKNIENSLVAQKRSVIKRPADSTTITTNGQTNTSKGQGRTTNRQTSTTSG